MALSRDRTWYFRISVIASLVVGVLTLGLVPLWDAARRLDRWRRLEWLQYADVMRWLGERTGAESAIALAADADDFAAESSLRSVVWIVVVIALTLIVWAAVVGGVVGVIQTVYWPISLLWMAIAYAAVLSIGWIWHLTVLLKHRAKTEMWIACVSDVMVDLERRPIDIADGPAPRGWLALGVVLAVIGPTWAGLQVVAVALQNRYIHSTRAVRLQLVERMLEWMDDSGLPVEFQVEEIGPEDVAANLA